MHELRGKCKELAEKLAEEKGYRLVCGYYYEPHWSKKEQHWWCVDDQGNIHDPTKEQFPSKGIKEFYEEFNGFVECKNCGETIKEENAIMQGRFPVCSGQCALRLVGL